MSKSKTDKKKVLSPKKQAQEQILQQLTVALPGLKDILGEKKFTTRVRKAAKVLSAGVKAKKAKPVKQATAEQAA